MWLLQGRGTAERSEGNVPLERPMYRWEGNTKIDLPPTVREDIDWIDLTEGRDKWWVLVKGDVKFRVP